MRGAIERKIRLGFLLAAALVFIMSFGFYHAVRQFLVNDTGIERSQQVLNQIEGLFTSLNDAENSERGYWISGDEHYLPAFDARVADLAQRLERLTRFVADNPSQVTRAGALGAAVKNKLASLRDRLEERRRYGAAVVSPQFVGTKTLLATEEVRRAMTKMSDEEDRLLKERHSSRQFHFHTALGTLAALGSVLSLLLVGVYLHIRRELIARRRIETELAGARDAAVSSARLKSEFLANMSHEIRTPMNGIIGMSGLLMDSKLGAEQREFAQTVQNCADSLLTIINDILDFSKIEAGKLNFEALDFNVRQTVESTIEIIAERAQSKGLELISLVDAAVPLDLRGDAGRVRQVLLNLLSNAVKFTEKGEVTLFVRPEHVGADSVRLLFQVVDSGVGLPAEAQKRIFQPFAQADGSTTRRYGGTGLGLAISRGLVERMNGRIGVKSEPGLGATFWFTAEFARQEAPPAAALRTLPDNLRVLIVDDNEASRLALAAMLKGWNIKHALASGGREAILSLSEARSAGKPFQMAIVDMQMPGGMGGFELTEKIKADPALVGTQLIMMHSIGRRGSAAAWVEAGINGYVTKPVKQSALFDAVADANDAGAKGSAPRLGLTPNGAPDPRRPQPILAGQQAFKATAELSRLMARPVTAQRLSTYRVLVAEDNMVNQKVALRQLLNLGFRAEAVANGREVLEAVMRIPYRLVLMDCQMPEMDGYEATRELRRTTANRNAPRVSVVAMTANALEGDRETCLAAGMDDYLSKPVKQEDLEKVLRRWLPADAFPPALAESR